MAIETAREEQTGWTLQTLIGEIARFGDQPALISVKDDVVDSWSFAGLADCASRLAGGLVRDGVASGEPVFLMGRASPDWVVVRLALGAVGALAVPCDHLATAEEVKRLLRDSGCRRAFVAAEHLALLREAAGDEPLAFHLLEGEDREGEAQSWRRLLSDAPVALPALSAEAPAVLVYTSGTTGAPKDFTLSSANIHANVAGLVAERLVGPDDRILLPLPLHHVYPFVVGLLVPLASGAAVIFPEGLAGPQIAEALRRGEATGIVGVPRLYAALVTNIEAQVAARGRLARAVFRRLLDLSIGLRRRFGWRAGRVLFRPLLARVGPRLRLLVSGGAALEERLIWQLEGLGWTVRNGYGLAETASTFTGNLPGRERIGSEGRPFQGGELRIAAPDEAGVGEIQLRGPNVFAGYRDNPAANREAFTEDGWFRTGDLGCLDAEGFLAFKGRSKELIVLGGGKNVFPEDLERAYGASPFIEEVAVLEHNGALHALVRPDSEAIRRSGTLRIEDSLRVELSAAGQRLPRYQRLAGYAIVREPLPRTRLGKYRRFLLPQLYQQALTGAVERKPVELSDEDRDFLRDPLAGQVWQLLQQRYPQRPFGLDASLQLDLGVDSLEWITLSLELERRLAVTLDESDVAEVYTARALIEAVQRAGSRPEGAARPATARQAVGDERWIQPGHPGHRLLAVTLFAVNWLLMRLLFRLKREGVDGPLPSGPLVIVANHVSDLDPLVMAAALPLATLRRVYWGGDVARLFAGPLRRFLCRALHIFPVDERAPAASLALAQAVLQRGDALIWFPEAWRSPTGELQPFLPGIGSLVERSGATALPAYIDGAFEAMPRWARLPRLRPIAVRFGVALAPAQLAQARLAGEEGATAAERITRSLERRVAALARRG
jgi:long-chain acyl-CoA synthetase